MGQCSHTAAATVVHEVSHAWTPYPADWPNRFSDEAIAQYLQAVVVDDIFGREAAAENIAIYRHALEATPEAGQVGLLRAGEHSGLIEVLTRCKGPLALHDLRSLLGEEKFWAILREYCSADKATARDFVDLLLRVGATTGIETYLRQWFY